MQKKLMAVAVAGALGAPAVAMAQASTVQIYGTLILEYGYQWSRDNGPVGSGQELISGDSFQAPGSNIGFKGEEKLGQNLTAWFQCESTADMRGAGNGGDGNLLCSRNSAIGFKGNWGNLYLGTWDTPMKKVRLANQVLNDTGFLGTSGIYAGGSSTYTNNQTVQSFSRRQQGLITYDSPVFSGFQIMGAYSVLNSNGASTPLTNTTTGVSGNKPRLWSLAATFNWKSLGLGAAYESHHQYQTGAGHPGTDSAWILGANYTFDSIRLKITGSWLHRKWENVSTVAGPAPFGDISQNTWQLSGLWNITGPHSLKLGYVQANSGNGSGLVSRTCVGSTSGNGSSTCWDPLGGTGANQWNLSYLYAFSKRTQLTVGYVYVNNKDHATYTVDSATTSAVQQGANSQAAMLRVDHKF